MANGVVLQMVEEVHGVGHVRFDGEAVYEDRNRERFKRWVCEKGCAY